MLSDLQSDAILVFRMPGLNMYRIKKLMDSYKFCWMLPITITRN